MRNLCFIILSALSLTVYAQQKKVAVYVTGDDPINGIMGDHLVDAIAHSGKYIAVERTASFLAELGKEQNYQRTGSVDDSEISRLGIQFGVSYVCVASPFDLFGGKYISARMIDVERAEVIATSSAMGAITNSTQFLSVLNNLTKGLLQSFEQSKMPGAKKVAVYVTRTGNKDIDIILGDQLVAGFTASGRYLAIERTQGFLNQLSKEKHYQETGAVSDEELMRLGRQFGVQYVCIAKTSQLFGDYFIATRLIDVEHGEVINSSKKDAVKLGTSQQVVMIGKEIAGELSGRTIEEERRFQIDEAQRIRRKQELLSQGYVDLGLPSGTCWRNSNEGGDYARYTYGEAVSRFSNKLPTKQQLEELKNECTWTLTGNGYKVTGTNGNSITLPAAGYRGCDGDVSGVGTGGRYWSSTTSGGSGYAWGLYFSSSVVNLCYLPHCSGQSVRLVQKL